MCGTPSRGIAGALASAYFSYFSYSHFSRGDYSSGHEWWTLLTYAVWVVLVVGLLTEPLCTRERIFFSLLLLTLLIGLAFSAWSSAPPPAVRQFRMASTVLWALAAVASLTTAFTQPKNGDAQRDRPEGVK